MPVNRINPSKNLTVFLVLFFFCMRRRKPVEGITLDLTDISGVIVVIPAAVPKEKPAPKEKKAAEPPTIEHIASILISMGKTCSDCSGGMFYPLKSWRGLKLCNSCHRIRHLALIEEIQPYLIEKGHTQCAFCHKLRTDPCEFHLDHINMYSKKGSVGPMMYNGASIEEIKEEIDKCQLLCISCHAAVTHFENKFGFIRAKKTKYKNIRQYKMEIYDSYMEVVYTALRARGGGR